jgi:hypothetical protein
MLLVHRHRRAERRFFVAARLAPVVLVFAIVARTLSPARLIEIAAQRSAAEASQAWLIVAHVLAWRVVFGWIVFLKIGVGVDLVQ